MSHLTVPIRIHRLRSQAVERGTKPAYGANGDWVAAVAGISKGQEDNERRSEEHY